MKDPPSLFFSFADGKEGSRLCDCRRVAARVLLHSEVTTDLGVPGATKGKVATLGVLGDQRLLHVEEVARVTRLELGPPEYVVAGGAKREG